MSMINDLHTLTGLGRALPALSPWSRQTPTTALEQRARTLPERTALMFEKQRYNWRQVNEHANRWAAVLGTLGVGQGDVVALLMDNRPDFLFALHGLGKLGASAALINTHLSHQPLTHAISISKARKVICGAEHLAAVRNILPQLHTLDAHHPLLVHAEDAGTVSDGGTGTWLNQRIRTAPVQREPTPKATKDQHLFAYIYTSGTTGLPKAAIISNVRALGAGTVAARLMLETRPDDVVYVPLPLYHSNALIIGWCGALATGCCIALRRKFSARQFWPDVRSFGATRFIYIGELCRYLLAVPSYPGERMHYIKYAVGNGLRPDIWQQFQQRFAVPTIREFYGSTEGTGALLNRQGKPGMVGRLQLGQMLVRCDLQSGIPVRDQRGRCQSVKEGEIGLLLVPIWPAVGFDGYLDRQASSDKVVVDVARRGDRFFNTGDLFQRHSERWLSFSDRVGDNFRWKGENISTNEVAEVCNQAPGILASNVYGVHVPGTDGRAGMAAMSIDTTFNIGDFAHHVMTHLQSYQRPLFLRLLCEEMKTTGTLKHQKVSYREDGFDPSKTTDPLYYLDGDRYQTLDNATFSRIEQGDIVIG